MGAGSRTTKTAVLGNKIRGGSGGQLTLGKIHSKGVPGGFYHPDKIDYSKGGSRGFCPLRQKFVRSPSLVHNTKAKRELADFMYMVEIDKRLY